MKEIHHSNIVLHTAGEQSLIFDFVENNLDFKIQGSPDFLLLENESFGIVDARDFGKWVIGKPISGEKKVAVIVTGSITFEAQNALLKILEEPPLGTYIFIGLPNVGNILPTFLSRMQVLNYTQKKCTEDKTLDQNNKTTSSKFFNSDIGSKLSITRSLSKGEDKVDMKNLIRDLEEVAYGEYFKNPSYSDKMKKILIGKIFASTRGSSPKMILEWLSCML